MLKFLPSPLIEEVNITDFEVFGSLKFGLVNFKFEISILILSSNTFLESELFLE